MKALKYLSIFFSIILHPLFIPIIGVFIIFNMPIYLNYLLSPDVKKYILLLLILSTILVPLILTLILQMTGLIKTSYIENKKERIIPYIATLILYVATLWFIYNIPLPKPYFILIETSIIAVFIAFIVNFFTKISSHLVGMGGLTGAIFVIALVLGINLNIFVAAAFLLSGIVGSSRMYLKAHTLSQVAIGFAVGFGAQFFLFLLI